MARTAALGDGPIAFFKDGVQIEVPLSAIYFEGDAVHTTRADLSPTPPEFDNWIKFLASRGRLVAGVASAVETAMTVTAAAPGLPGNNIQVDVKPATNLDESMVDVIVSKEDLYKGLTLTSLVLQLGTSTVQGTQPGFLRVKTAVPAGAVAPGTDPVTFTDAVSPARPTWTISGTGATAVMLEPERIGTGFSGTDFTVTVSEASVAGAGTFTLKVVWKKTLRNVSLTGLPAALNTEFGYLVTFAAPAGASRPPQLGKVTLTGGNESVAATQAVATILAPG